MTAKRVLRPSTKKIGQSLKGTVMYHSLKISLLIFLFAFNSHAENALKNDLSKIQTALKEFKAKNKEPQLPELTTLKNAVEEGSKTIQTVLLNIFGSKEEIKQALKDYSAPSSPIQKNKAARLLAFNFLRFSNASLQKLDDRLPKKSEFSKEDLQKMEQASKELTARAEIIKVYAQRVTPEQIRYISQDNSNPNIPRILLWPLGTDKTCTKEMVEKIRADIGSENFDELSSAMMLTGSSYEALYEPLYSRRIIEVLKKDPSEEAREILAQVTPDFFLESVERSYNTFMKQINSGEEKFVRLFGPQVTKKDARLFFQGYARKYPFCLGILSPEYARIKSKDR